MRHIFVSLEIIWLQATKTVPGSVKEKKMHFKGKRSLMEPSLTGIGNCQAVHLPILVLCGHVICHLYFFWHCCFILILAECFPRLSQVWLLVSTFPYLQLTWGITYSSLKWFWPYTSGVQLLTYNFWPI